MILYNQAFTLRFQSQKELLMNFLLKTSIDPNLNHQLKTLKVKKPKKKKLLDSQSQKKRNRNKKRSNKKLLRLKQKKPK